MYRDLLSRHTLRLPGFDYSSSNWYYVTICTHKREEIFGDVIIPVGASHVSPVMQLNSHGHIVDEIWRSIPRHHDVKLDVFQIMPNHLHGVIVLNNGRENPAPTLGQIIAYFKYQTTKEYNRVGAGFSRPCDQYNKLWQRNYYEHIIRNEGELTHIRQYIEDNPKNWETDELYG